VATAAKPRKEKPRFVMPRGAGDSRTLIFLISVFLQRADILRRQAYRGDMEQAIIAGMVGIGATSHLMFEPAYRETFGDMRTIIGMDLQRGINSFSIAEATGIPRETVRRKLKELEVLGAVLQKSPGRYVYAVGHVQRPENIAAVDEVVRGALQLMNACVSLDVVRWVDEDIETVRVATAQKKNKPCFAMPRGAGDSRTLIFLISVFFQRCDILRRQAYQGDMEQAIIVGMVAISAASHLMLETTYRQAFGNLRTIIGVDPQRGVNSFSIAEATGIPRETVRRKLKELETLGAVVQKSRGRYVMSPGYLQRPESMAVIDEMMRAALQLMNSCVNLDVVRWVDPETEGQGSS
jgi:hypothetical protein